MPRVPATTGPTIGDQPLSSAGLSRTNPQPVINQQAADFGRQLQDVGAAIQERQDADLIMRAETDIKGKYLEWEGQAKQRKGQQAWGVAKEAAEWWEKEGAQVADSLQTPIQKRLFSQTVAKLRAQSVGQFSGYEAGQRRESLDASAQASIVGSINLAAANPGNGELLTSAKQDILRRTDMLAKLNGWDPAVKDVKQAEYLTNFHKQVIQGLVRDNPAAAETYFQTNKAEIEGSQHAEVGGFAATATATRLGEQAAEQAWQTLGPKSDRDPVQLDKLEEQVRKSGLADEARKVAISALRERATAFKDARRERDDQLEASVNQAILDGKSAREIRSMPSFLSLSPESARKIVDFMESRALRHEQRAAAQESRADAAEARGQRRMAREGMGAYLQYSNPDTLRSMTEAQVLNLLPTLGNDLTRDLMEKRRTLNNPAKLAEARMDTDDFNHIAQQIGIDPFRTANRAQVGELRYRVEQMISAAQQGGNKSLTRDEKMNLMRQEMARTVTVDGWFSSAKDVPVIALKPEDIKNVVVPASDRREIADGLRAMAQKFPNDPRFAPTEDNLKRWYLKGKSSAAGLIPNAK